MSKREVSVRIFEIEPVKKESAQQTSSDESVAEYLEPLNDYDALARIYSETVYHSGAINVKAHAIAGVGFGIVRADEGEKANPKDEEYKKIKRFIDEHYDYAGQSFIETLKNFVTDYLIFGDAYLEGVPSTKGEIIELYHLKTIETRLKADPNGKAEKNKFLRRLAVQISGDKHVTFYPYTERYKNGRPSIDGKPANYYFRLSSYTPRKSAYGEPEYIPAIISMSLMRSGLSYNIHFFKNYGMPAFAVIVNNGELSQEAFGRLKKFLREEYRGVENAGKGIILETGAGDEPVKIEIKELSKIPKDEFYKQLKADARDDIISAHRVPPRLLGVAGANKLGDTTETKAQMSLFQEVVIAPEQRRLEDFLNNIFRKGMGITKYKIQLNPFYVSDPKADADFYEKMINADVISPDEAREELGYAPREKSSAKIDKTAEGLLDDLVKLRKKLSEAVNEN